MTTWPRRTTATACVLAAVLAGGCDSGEDPRTGPPALEGEPSVVAEPPHFVGERVVTLAAGQPAVSDEACADDEAPYWVCDPLQKDRFRTWGEPRPAVLREARMDVAQGGLSWTVTVRFDRPGRRLLAEVREQARATGATVLVLDEDDEVLVSVAVPDAEGDALRLGRLTKPEAWDTVERLAGT